MPAGHAEHAVQVGQHQPGRRRADEAGKGGGEEQHRGDPAPVGGREPQRQKIQHAGREAGFHGADQEAQRVELPLVLHERHQRGGDAPRDHDARDPAPRADLVQHHVAGDFEQHVADREQAGADAVRRVGQRQAALQREFGEADVDAVEKGEQVADHDEGHDAPRHLRHDPRHVGGGDAGRARRGGKNLAHVLSPDWKVVE